MGGEAVFPAFLLLLLVCTVRGQRNIKHEIMTDSFENVLSEVQEKWMDIEGVQAVGQGVKEDRDCIDVLVIEDNPALRKLIPKEYKGIPVVIRESGGPIRPLE